MYFKQDNYNPVVFGIFYILCLKQQLVISIKVYNYVTTTCL